MDLLTCNNNDTSASSKNVAVSALSGSMCRSFRRRPVFQVITIGRFWVNPREWLLRCRYHTVVSRRPQLVQLRVESQKADDDSGTQRRVAAGEFSSWLRRTGDALRSGEGTD